MTDQRFHWIALLLLAGCSVVLAWPVLMGGGATTYLDNPVHLAETHALAHSAGAGWSDVAFCGFPVHQLHSPLWYGALAALTRVGLPLDLLYALALWLGFLAPSLALYLVAHRRVGTLPAAVLSFILLIQRPALVGLGSAPGGMWTFSLASAILILLVFRLAQPHRTARDVAWTAALFGLLGLTHLFAIPPAVLALVLLALLRRGRRVAHQALAALLGAAASAVYWLPWLLAAGGRLPRTEHLTGGLLLARLLLPTRMFGLLAGNLDSRSLPGDLHYTDALPLVLLMVLGLVGLGLARRKLRPRDEFPLVGGLLALCVLLVLLLAPAVDLPLGPVSWRFAAFIRVGAALAALPALAWLGDGLLRQRRGLAPALGLAALVSCWWWGRPLAAEVTPMRGAEMDEVRLLWRGLAQQRDPGWGRVYLQDTLLTPPFQRRLGMSHVLALTARETGVHQLGAAYGITPFTTAAWTRSEMGLIYGQPLRGPRQLRRLLWMMERTNATHLVVSDPVLARILDRVSRFRRLLSAGRFSVYHRRGAVSRWAAPLTPTLTITSSAFRPGRVRVAVNNRRAGGRLLIKVSAAPGWRLSGVAPARLSADRSGLMVVRELPAGTHALELSYEPARYPGWITVAGWVLICGLVMLRRRPQDAA